MLQLYISTSHSPGQLADRVMLLCISNTSAIDAVIVVSSPEAEEVIVQAVVEVNVVRGRHLVVPHKRLQWLKGVLPDPVTLLQQIIAASKPVANKLV